MRSSSSSIACGPTSPRTICARPSSSSRDATGATAPADRRRVLRKRIISALVLIPLALAGAGRGSPYFDLLVALFGGAMAWEWVRVCNRGRFPARGAVAVAAVPAAMLALQLWGFPGALATLAAGVALAGLAGLPGRALWHALG